MAEPLVNEPQPQPQPAEGKHAEKEVKGNAADAAVAVAATEAGSSGDLSPGTTPIPSANASPTPAEAEAEGGEGGGGVASSNGDSDGGSAAAGEDAGGDDGGKIMWDKLDPHAAQYMDPNCDRIYDLSAMSIHLGIMGGGHYVAYGKNQPTDKWVFFNDSSAREVPDERVGKENGYCLFYTARGLNPASFLPEKQAGAGGSDDDGDGADGRGSPDGGDGRNCSVMLSQDKGAGISSTLLPNTPGGDAAVTEWVSAVSATTDTKLAIKVTVNPPIHLDKLDLLFHVVLETSLPIFDEPRAVAARRYSHFCWLMKRLGTRMQPPEPLTYLPHSLEAVESQRRALQATLERLVQKPKYQSMEILHVFFQSTVADTQLDWLVRIDGLHFTREETNASAGGSLRSGRGSVLSSPGSSSTGGGGGAASSRASLQSLPSGKASKSKTKRVVKYRRASTTEASSTGVSTGVSTGDDATSTEGGDLKQHRRAGGSGGGGAIAGSSSRVGGGGRKYQYADFVELQRHSGSHSSRSRGAGGVGGGGGGGNGSGGQRGLLLNRETSSCVSSRMSNVQNVQNVPGRNSPAAAALLQQQQASQVQQHVGGGGGAAGTAAAGSAGVGGGTGGNHKPVTFWIALDESSRGRASPSGAGGRSSGPPTPHALFAEDATELRPRGHKGAAPVPVYADANAAADGVYHQQHQQQHRFRQQQLLPSSPPRIVVRAQNPPTAWELSLRDRKMGGHGAAAGPAASGAGRPSTGGGGGGSEVGMLQKNLANINIVQVPENNGRGGGGRSWGKSEWTDLSASPFRA
eukprot:gene2082-6473_t